MGNGGANPMPRRNGKSARGDPASRWIQKRRNKIRGLRMDGAIEGGAEGDTPFAPPGPLLLPRESTESTELQDYHIPKGTKVVING
ncbi:hypothetical protein ZIOFF_027143 [Zingiber officinale]|uniref:Uncharacterized protein n=1 Tax=Zingiber officinale TaxID=94328 RepID=A0A8J5GYD5_ZINOF|nr:hypothetical protein ZIOFF_027143 [Zingiber officinale]